MLGMTKGTVLPLIVVVTATGCIDFEGTIRNVRSFPKLRNGFPDELVSHFPRDVPPPSQRPSFYYSPGPLQATEEMQLFVTLPPDQIARLFNECERKASEHYVGVDEKTFERTSPEGLPTYWWPSNLTFDPPLPLSPADHVFVLFSNVEADPVDVEFRAEAGIVINRKVSTALYYCHFRD